MTVGNVPRANEEDTGPWDAALEQLRSWDPAWADTCARMTANPWRLGALSRKLIDAGSNRLSPIFRMTRPLALSLSAAIVGRLWGHARSRSILTQQRREAPNHEWKGIQPCISQSTLYYPRIRTR